VNATLLSLLIHTGVQNGLERAREALARGDYHAAWQGVDAHADELEQSLGRAEILDAAGDPAGALRAACTGLERDPRHVRLLFLAARAAIWLQDGPAGIAYSARLGSAASTHAVASAGGEDKWEERAQSLASHGETLVLRERSLAGALRRFRSITILGLVAWALAIWSSSRVQGRSSRPVS
jgi:hypothetical protein